MRNLRKISLIILIVLVLNMMTGINVYASNSKMTDVFKPMEYTEEYKEYLKLSNEEKAKVMAPRMFELGNKKEDILSKLYNLIANKLGSNNLEEKYSLKDVIPNNVVVKNQEKTSTCWAFAAISSLETNLAIKNKDAKTYDFSERHMNYATSRVFKDGRINERGFNRKVDDGGTFFMSIAYFTNGMGAVDEASMPFENNNNDIDISEIQKKITSEVNDVKFFYSASSTEDTSNLKTEIKEHIKKYGAVAAQVYGANLINDYYNNTNAALYCDDENICSADHAVSIVGWDDTFSKENFNEDHRPQNDGAWLVKNSWGTVYEEDATKVKQTLYEMLQTEMSQTELEEKGITDYTKITDELLGTVFNKMGYEIEVKDGTIKMNVGKNGFMYISYEDVNIYSNLIGIENASDTLDYDNLYQYDELGMSNGISGLAGSKIYLANKFTKQSSGNEYLQKVSLFATQPYKCKVYVNPASSSIQKNDLQKITLTSGETETIDVGYHTLEFLNPIEITGNNFAVVIEIEKGDNSNDLTVPLESKVENSAYSEVKLESGKCFITFDNYFEQNDWIDLSEINSLNSSLPNGDTTIKAFTTLSKDNEQEVETGENIKSTKYNVTESAKTVDKIEPNTEITQFKNNITSNEAYQIFDKDGKEIDSTGIITTGSKVKTSSGLEYQLIVKGDTTGDGKADLSDMIVINNYRLYNTTRNFGELYQKAADVNKDNLIDLKDMIFINNYRLYGTKM